MSILLLLTITSCATSPKNDINLPPRPQREELPEVKDIKDMAGVIVYYEYLVKEWELWADAVEKITKTR